MKAPLIATALILAAGLLWGWSESRQVSLLKETRLKALRQADAFGISINPDRPGTITRNSRKERERNAKKVRDLYDRLVLRSKKQRSSDPAGEAEIEEHMALFESVYALNGEELLELLKLIKTNKDFTPEYFREMEIGLLLQLAAKAPEKALGLLQELGENPQQPWILQQALSQYAKDNPIEAMAWLKKNAEKYPKLIDDPAKKRLLATIAQKDPALALSYLSEFKFEDSNRSALSIIARNAQTPEHQHLLLERLREMETDETQSRNVKNAKIQLYSEVFKSGFTSTQTWLQSANLTPEETGDLARNLNYYYTKEDTGKWLDWLSKADSLDSKNINNSATELFSSWTENDYAAAGTWLNQAPDGPVKTASVFAYIRTIARYDPEVATQWADTLPEENRPDLYKCIHRRIKDPAEAAAYAETHGLKK
ncbi:MAG: hypothetical protein QM680_02245 [Luteolibacter sp.]